LIGLKMLKRPPRQFSTRRTIDADRGHRVASLRPKDSGFTLLEILLALGLSVVLLVAVAAAIDLFRRFTTAGQDDLAEARLVRAVLRKIETDIRSTVPPQPAPSTATTSSGSSSGSSGSSSGGSSGSSSSSSQGNSSSSSSNSSSSSSSSSSSTQPTQSVYANPLDTIFSGSVFGLYGDARMLVINTLRPHRPAIVMQQQVATQPALAGIHGDFKTVAYFLWSDGAGNSAVISSSQPGDSPTAAHSGLARLEGDRMAISYAMEKSSSLGMATSIVAPEVATLSFRYFDGYSWYPSWDGATLQALPQAVEIVIGVRVSNTGSPQQNAAGPTLAQIRTYRHVVPLYAAAAPASTSTSSSP